MTRDEILRENRRGGGMFAVIPSVVMLDTQLSASAKLLYGIITWRSGKFGFCWATNDTLAEDVGLSAKRITPLIAQLEERGHIETEILPDKTVTGGKRRNIYPVVRSTRGLVGGILKNEDTLSSETRIPSPQKRGDGILKNEEIKKKRENNNKTPIVPAEIAERIEEYCGEDTELRSGLMDLLANRATVKKSKSVQTLPAINRMLSKLDRESGGDRTTKLWMIDNAIEHNWDTVYGPKSETEFAEIERRRAQDMPSAPAAPREETEYGVVLD